MVATFTICSYITSQTSWEQFDKRYFCHIWCNTKYEVLKLNAGSVDLENYVTGFRFLAKSVNFPQRLAVTLRPLPTSSSSLWWLCQRCPSDKPLFVKSRWVPCPVSPLWALAGCLSLPCVLPLLFTDPLLCVWLHVAASACLTLSVCPHRWPSAHSGLCFSSLVCFASSLNLTFK